MLLEYPAVGSPLKSNRIVRSKKDETAGRHALLKSLAKVWLSLLYAKMATEILKIL